MAKVVKQFEGSSGKITSAHCAWQRLQHELVSGFQYVFSRGAADGAGVA
ncbi:MAG: hypothetical protein LBD74_08355 [Spirochaetaceae bacterium]|nr:hypothetical protein [Spirochaetaceae bacterium]